MIQVFGRLGRFRDTQVATLSRLRIWVLPIRMNSTRDETAVRPAAENTIVDSEPWKSTSIRSTRLDSATAQSAARLAASVVLPTPPLRFPMVITGRGRSLLRLGMLEKCLGS